MLESPRGAHGEQLVVPSTRTHHERQLFALHANENCLCAMCRHLASLPGVIAGATALAIMMMMVKIACKCCATRRK